MVVILQQIMKEQIVELRNGIRVVYTPSLSHVAHCGFIINTGSRDEHLKENGIVHFIEHAIFKGTSKRKTHHILNRIDNVGGEINAFTTKENTNVYASFTSIYLERAVELLTDIVFNSTFPDKELIKEKEVVIDEICSYQDTPYEQIYDDFESQVFKKHPLSYNILGTVKSVSKLNRNDLLSFFNKNYGTNEIVFSIVGNFSTEKIKRITQKYLSNIPSKITNSKRKKFTGYSPAEIILTKDTHQAHCTIGNIAYDAYHPKKNTFILLNNILGGPAMNSKLNMGIREKYGLTYNIESSYNFYSDTGLFSIYLGTDNKHIYKTIDLVKKELKNLKSKKLSHLQLKNAKRQLIGQTTLSEENNCNVMLGQGKSLLQYNYIESLDEVYKKIEAITENELLDVANEIFNEKQLSTLLFKPTN